MRKSKYLFYILFIIIGLLLVILPLMKREKEDKYEEEKIDSFFENNESNQSSDNEVIEDTQIRKEKEEYIMVLEIPKIELFKGIYDKDSVYNNIEYNIQILKEADMPDKENSTLILASHRGNSSVAYFDRLYELETGDIVYIYYNDSKYTYEIDYMYKTLKNGTIKVEKETNKNIIVLITCDKEDKTQQLVYVGNLVSKTTNG